MPRKPVFFTSDQHFNHANSIKFDNRPFKDVEHMNRSLIKNYNNMVPENGICYFLGDVGMGSVESLKEIISQLNGTKVCILGNHDRNSNAMYNLGFDIVLNSATIYIANERVTMSHCPLPGLFREDITGMRNAVEGDNWHGESRQMKFMVQDEGQFHLHGHIHSTEENAKLTKDGKQWDIGVCGNKYRPVHIKNVESWIARYKQGRS